MNKLEFLNIIQKHGKLDNCKEAEQVVDTFNEAVVELMRKAISIKQDNFHDNITNKAIRSKNKIDKIIAQDKVSSSSSHFIQKSSPYNLYYALQAIRLNKK